MSELQSLGNYQVECELGSGAMGVVYKAYDPVTQRHVAIKTIHRSFHNTDLGNEVLARFEREADTSFYLQHPNIVKTLSTGQRDELHYKVMEFVDGKDLKTLLIEKTPFSIDKIIEIVEVLLSAMSCAHEEGIVHGHIKPANILIDQQGKVRVTDFGMICTDNSSTIASTILATLFYMSPEQCKGEKIDARSDLFSIGIVLYELLAAQRPFRGDHSAIIMANIINAEPVPPSRVNQDIPPDFDHIVRKALEKDVQRRYQSAREFRKDLLAINTHVQSHAVAESHSGFGKYRVEHVLGEGAMGVVYKAYDPGLDRHVAIKAIRKHLMDTDTGRAIFARFRNEAKLASRLVHPNIVAVYEFDQDKGTPYFVMEYVDGVDLHTALKKGKIFTLDDILPIVDAVLRALSYTHEFGIVHRDIKPANIFISRKGEIKVSDFSIARQENSDLTEVGTVIGTPSYMSPEQCTGSEVDGRSDLFSVGVMLYELLTDQKPFEGENYSSVMYKVVNAQPPLPSFINHQLPKRLDAIIEKALAKDPANRFATADDFRQALQMLSLPEPVSSVPRSRKPLVWGSVLAGLFAASAVFIYEFDQEPAFEKSLSTVQALIGNALSHFSSARDDASSSQALQDVHHTPAVTEKQGRIDRSEAALSLMAARTEKTEGAVENAVTLPLPAKEVVVVPTRSEPKTVASSPLASPAPLPKKSEEKPLSKPDTVPVPMPARNTSEPVTPQLTADRIVDESKAALRLGQRDKAINLLEAALSRPGMDESTRRVVSVHLLGVYQDAIEDALATRQIHMAQALVSKMRLLAVSASIVASYERRILLLDIDIEAKKEAARERAAKEAARAEEKRQQLLSQEPTEEMMIY